MTIQYYYDLEQGTDEWFELRRGIITASEMKLLLSPTLKIANNDKTRAHLYELAAQRISGYVEPSYLGDDMIKGNYCESIARDLYSEHYEPVKECGFITRTLNGVTVGFSPDGLCGEHGAIEIKSRRQKFQIESIINNECPKEHYMQCQTGLWVTQREWIDYVSYSDGLPMFVKRVLPDAECQDAITEVIQDADEKIKDLMRTYEINSKDLIPTERIEILENDDFE